MARSALTTYRPLWPAAWSELFRFPEELGLLPRMEEICVDEYRENGSYVIRAEVPGIDPDKDVRISIDSGSLIIDVDRRKESKVQEKDYIHQEMQYGHFSRSLRLPAGCTEKDVKATYHDGILEVRLPVGKETSKRIPVTVSR